METNITSPIPEPLNRRSLFALAGSSLLALLLAPLMRLFATRKHVRSTARVSIHPAAVKRRSDHAERS